MLDRVLRSALRDRLRRFPVVTIVGPRQSGKTTFVRAALPGWACLDLERPADAAPLMADPKARLARRPDWG
jgi:uncharacterized protein